MRGSKKEFTHAQTLAVAPAVMLFEVFALAPQKEVGARVHAGPRTWRCTNDRWLHAAIARDAVAVAIDGVACRLYELRRVVGSGPGVAKRLISPPLRQPAERSHVPAGATSSGSHRSNPGGIVAYACSFQPVN